MYQPSCTGLVLVLLYYEIYQTEDVLKTLGDIVSVIRQDEWQLVFCWHCSDSVVWRCTSGCVVECRICNREVAGSNLNLLCTKVYSAFHPSWVGKWVPAIAEKAKAGMAHSDCGWTCGCAGKTVKSLENTCHTWALLRWWFTTKRRDIKCMDFRPLPLPLPVSLFIRYSRHTYRYRDNKFISYRIIFTCFNDLSIPSVVGK